MDLVIHLLILTSIFAILGITLDLVVGYTGLLSVTHAAFFGIGAYATAILNTAFEWNFFATLPVGILIAAVIGLFMGYVMSRFEGDYYALVSFGFNIIIFSIFLNWQSLTRGPLGIPGIRKPELLSFVFKENIHFLLLALLLLGIIYYLSRKIVSSSFGRALKGIREDEKALQVFGYDTHAFKIVIFALSAGLASIGGSLFASYISFIEPSSFALIESVFILAVVILGGLGSLRGPVLGAVILILLPEILRFVGLPIEIAAQMRQVIYGLLLIIMMMYRPQGFLGEYKL